MLLEVELTYDLVCPSFGLSVGWLVDQSIIISLKGEKLRFHAPIGAPVYQLPLRVIVAGYTLLYDPVCPAVDWSDGHILTDLSII